MTVSSVTTATPPRLDDSSFSIKSNDDDFGNMFAGLGSRSSQEVRKIIWCLQRMRLTL